MNHPSLDGAFQRLHRAGEHISELRRLIERFIGGKLDALREEFAAHPSVESLQSELGIVPGAFSIRVGETVYNLRAALDYLVYTLAWSDSGEPQEHTQFPLEDSEPQFRNVRANPKSNGCYLRGISSQHIEMIAALQPYNGVKWSARLRNLSNPDKHRHLHALYSASIVSAVDAVSERDDAVLTVPVGDVNFYVRFRVALDDGSRAVRALEEIEAAVADTLDTFQREFE